MTAPEREPTNETPPAQRPLGARVAESWEITYPIIASSLSTLALALVDTAILGRYSTEALAAVGLALPIYVFASALIIPWGTAVQILVARWRGAEDHSRISRILDVGLLVCLAIGVGMTLVLLAIAGPLVALLSDGDPLPDATTVLRILACSLPFVAVTAHYRGAFGGLKHTRIAMKVALLVALTNIPLDIALVYGLDLGAIGSAIATLVATLLGAIYITIFGLRRFAHTYRYPRRANLTDARSVARPLWRVGWPDASFGAGAYGSDLLLINLVATLGAVSLAAHRTLSSTIMVVWVVVFGCSTGTSILAGQQLGAKDLDGVAAYRRAGTALTALLATPLLLPALIVPSWYFGLFTDDPSVITEAARVAPLLLGFLACQVISMPFTGVLRAGGDTKGIMVLGLVAQLGVAVPLAYLATGLLGMGLVGVFLGVVVGQLARAGLTLLRYRTGVWQRDPDEAPVRPRARR